MNLLDKFLILDRRWVFLLMALAIIIPLLLNITLPFTPDKAVEAIYNELETLEPGTRVLVSCDYDPGSKPELQPFAVALFYYLFTHELSPVITCLWPGAPPLVESALLEVTAMLALDGRAAPLNHIDYVNLGYKQGAQFVMLSMGSDMRGTFPLDYTGTPIDEIPVMDGIENLNSFDLFVEISAGSAGTKEWVQTVQGRYDLRLAAACTAVMAPDCIPYLQANQLFGLAGGMKGSADFEKLVYDGTDYIGQATIGMNAQSFGHLVIIIFIILGNIAFFATREKR
ncbi:MAG: hypothetical protein ISR91_03910 [Candidatus Delongbacteria bacterium]|nr:hypothetical protein [Candidatus Delongbacteria bacterium]